MLISCGDALIDFVPTRNAEGREAVMPAVMRLTAGLWRSIMPKVNCGIFARAPVGVQPVRAMAFAQMSESANTSGIATIVIQ